jgi:UDP-GlcNAc:undecaprenyl-phosphate GlcNAc-1-phosphate transferase
MPPQREFLVASFAFAVALATLPLFKRAAEWRRWTDIAGDDPLKIHAGSTPFIGGLGIASGCVISLVFHRPPQLAMPLAFILLLGWTVAAVGFIDDIARIRPAVRLIIESLVGTLLGAGALVLSASGPHEIHVSGMIGVAGLLLVSALYVVGGINAVNMQDGLDGLAGGVVLISCFGFGIIGARTNDELMLALALALGGAVAAFLVYNSQPASIFMGDNGSYFLGFLVATMALLLTSRANGASAAVGGILIIGLPVFDAGVTLLRRIRRGVSPLLGDRSHFYDALVHSGCSVRHAVLISYGVQVLFVAAGVIVALSDVR